MKTETIIIADKSLCIDGCTIDDIIAKYAKRAPVGCYWSVTPYKNGNRHVKLVW